MAEKLAKPHLNHSTRPYLFSFAYSLSKTEREFVANRPTSLWDEASLKGKSRQRNKDGQTSEPPVVESKIITGTLCFGFSIFLCRTKKTIRPG